MYKCMQQLNKKKSTRAVDAHTGTVYIQRYNERNSRLHTEGPMWRPVYIQRYNEILFLNRLVYFFVFGPIWAHLSPARSLEERERIRKNIF